MTEPEPAVEAWRTFCAGLEDAVVAALTARPDLSERDRQEGLRYLSNQLADALRSQVAIPRAEGPYFYRFSDELSPHGFPNADNNYLCSTLDPSGTYLLSGTSIAPDFIVTLASGHFPTWDYQEVAELSSTDIAFDADGRFSITIGGPAGPGVLTMPATTAMLLIRSYVVDWDADPPLFHLERIDPPEAADGGTEAAQLPARLALARQFFDGTAMLWGDYSERLRSSSTPNEFSPLGGMAMGSAAILGYSSAHLKQELGEALVVELDPPTDAYWSIQLYNRWGVLPAAGIAQTSLNCRQVLADQDGRIRIVVCATDPGVANWLDTRGLTDALVWLRAKPWEAFPTPAALTLPVERVADKLSGAVPVSPEDRRTLLARRDRHMSRRFRR